MDLTQLRSDYQTAGTPNENNYNPHPFFEEVIPLGLFESTSNETNKLLFEFNDRVIAIETLKISLLFEKEIYLVDNCKTDLLGLSDHLFSLLPIDLQNNMLDIYVQSTSNPVYPLFFETKIDDGSNTLLKKLFSHHFTVKDVRFTSLPFSNFRLDYDIRSKQYFHELSSVFSKEQRPSVSWKGEPKQEHDSIRSRELFFKMKRLFPATPLNELFPGKNLSGDLLKAPVLDFLQDHETDEAVRMNDVISSAAFGVFKKTKDFQMRQTFNPSQFEAIKKTT